MTKPRFPTVRSSWLNLQPFLGSVLVSTARRYDIPKKPQVSPQHKVHVVFICHVLNFNMGYPQNFRGCKMGDVQPENWRITSQVGACHSTQWHHWKIEIKVRMVQKKSQEKSYKDVISAWVQMIQNDWYEMVRKFCQSSCGFILGIKQGIVGHSRSLQLTLASAFHPTTSKQGQWSDKTVHASCQNERREQWA